MGGRIEDAALSVAPFSPSRRRSSARTHLTRMSTSTTVLSEGRFREPWTPSDRADAESAVLIRPGSMSDQNLQPSPRSRFCPRLEQEVLSALASLAEKQAQATRQQDPDTRLEKV